MSQTKYGPNGQKKKSISINKGPSGQRENSGNINNIWYDMMT